MTVPGAYSATSASPSPTATPDQATPTGYSQGQTTSSPSQDPPASTAASVSQADPASKVYTATVQSDPNDPSSQSYTDQDQTNGQASDPQTAPSTYESDPSSPSNQVSDSPGQASQTSADPGGNIASLLAHSTDPLSSSGPAVASSTGVGDIIASVLGMQPSTVVQDPAATDPAVTDPAATDTSAVETSAAELSDSSISTQTYPTVLITIGSQIMSQDATSLYIIGSQTLSAGGPAITVDGSELSLAPAATAVVVNSRTTPLLKPTTDPPGSPSLTALIIPGATLMPGSSAVLSGTTYSLPTDGNGVFVNGISTSIPNLAVGQDVTLGSLVASPTLLSDFSVDSDSGVTGINLQGSTLLPGSDVVLSGTTYSLDPNGQALRVNGQETMSQAFTPGEVVTIGSVVASAVVATLPPSSVQALTLGSKVFTYAPQGTDFIFGTQTLAPQAWITVGGETLSLGSSGVIVADGSITRTLNRQSAMTTVLTLGTSRVTLTRTGSAYMVSGKTLLPGSTVVLGDSTISLPAGETQPMVVGAAATSTNLVPSLPGSRTVGGPQSFPPTTSAIAAASAAGKLEVRFALSYMSMILAGVAAVLFG
jgi:hypothetical protein